jgi:hypothetical protein
MHNIVPMSSQLSTLIEYSTLPKELNVVFKSNILTSLESSSLINHIEELFNKTNSRNLKKEAISVNFKLYHLIRNKRVEQTKLKPYQK